jgi:hypothetical protein
MNAVDSWNILFCDDHTESREVGKERRRMEMRRERGAKEKQKFKLPSYSIHSFPQPRLYSLLSPLSFLPFSSLSHEDSFAVCRRCVHLDLGIAL